MLLRHSSIPFKHMGCNSSSLVAAVAEKHTATDWQRIVTGMRIAVRQKKNATKWAGFAARIQDRDQEKHDLWREFFTSTPYLGEVVVKRVRGHEMMYAGD